MQQLAEEEMLCKNPSGSSLCVESLWLGHTEGNADF